MNEDFANRVKSDPIYHVVNVQGVKTTKPFQKRIFKSVAENERTAVSACHDVGKTWTASKIVLWFTSTFVGSKVITTAPTFNQVKRLLWSEIRSGFSKSKIPLGGEMLLTEWQLAEDWFAFGFTSRNERVEGEGQGGASSFQGFHAPYILVVFDEATGIPLSIWKQVEGLLTSHFVRFLAIGNPTTKACEFFKCFSDPAWFKIKLSCFDSPNFPANELGDKEDLLREINRLKELSQEDQFKELQKYKVVDKNLLTVRWVVGMILKWGMKHPLVVSKCFGEFPEEDKNCLISLGVVQTAQFRDSDPKLTDRVSIGVDVARFGIDQTVITRIHGFKVVEKKVLVKRDTQTISGEVVRMIKDSNHSVDIHVAVDATGIGSGVIDNLRMAKIENVIPEQVEIRECHFGAGPGGLKGSDSERDLKGKYVNLKARIFVELSEDLKNELSLIEEDIYLEELPTIQYGFDSKGRWYIESKEEYTKRTGRSSPDHADSLAIANYARREEPGVGQFTEDLIQQQNSTIINYPRETNLW